MKKAQLCIHCKKKFKRVKSHERFCPERLYTRQMTQQPEPLEFKRRDLDLAERVGYDKGKKDTEQKFNVLVQGTQIKAVEAAAKAVEAIAHMMVEFKIR